jgi:multidrug efflux pump subunit AcrA (membrane-fusion protein)
MNKKTLFEHITTIILLAICIGLAAIVANNYLNTGEAADGQRPMMEARQDDNTVNVSAVTVERGTFTKTTTVGAEIESSIDPVTLYSTLVGGTLTSLTIEEGDEVAAGDVIGTVDPSTPGKEYKETSITSTASGIVYSLDAYVGEQITTSTAIATLVKAGDLQISAELPERLLSKVQVGSKATFSTAAWPEETASATVSRIGAKVDTDTRTFETTLSLDEQDPRLKEGMYVTLDLVTEQIDDCVAIPVDAISSYLGDPVVFVVEDGVARRVAITTSSSDNTATVVTSGLEGGEQLIVAGSVVDGTQVQIIEEQL